MSHIKRADYLMKIIAALEITPVCALLGPRKCGKTALSKVMAETYEGPVFTFDLEDESDLEKLSEPFLALSRLEGLIIIDGAHLLPKLFETLRVLVDEKKNRRFLILSFAPHHLLQKTSESLAGCIIYIEMMPFSIGEIKEVERHKKLWIRGGLPQAFLSKNTQDSWEWRKSYIKDFLKSDMRTLGFNVSPQVMRRFWFLLAEGHGERFNASKIARELDVTPKTVWSYLDVLKASYMVRSLNPWVANISKRQVKSPRIYFRDTGILHSFLNIQTYEDLTNHPKIESSWRGHAMEEVIHYYSADPEDCYYWETQNGAGIDLLIVKDGIKMGFQFQFSDKNKRTKSVDIAKKDLGLDMSYSVTTKEKKGESKDY